MSKATKNLTKDTVIPRTVTFLHKLKFESRKMEVENITYDYQTIAEVFMHIVGEPENR
jgi:hypothetical protein